MASSKELETIIRIKGKVDASVEKSFDSIEKAAKGAMKNLPGNIAKGLGNGVQAATKALGTATLAVGAGFAAAGAAAVAFGADCVQAATSYDQAFRNMSTLVDETTMDMEKMSDDILKVSSETGIAAEDIANSVYSAISAGISQEDAVEFAGKSAKLAAAGFTDVDTALTTVAKTLNAYGLDASHTDEIQKMLIQTQNKGITTVGELGASLAQVTPTAAAFGVGFDQVSAAIATMTAQGTATAQSTTQLNSLIAELGKSGTVASKNFAKFTEHIQEGGLTFAEAMERGWDMNDVLSLFSEEADVTGKSMVDMFSSIEAGKAALSIWNGNFTENLVAMGTDADVVGEAYDKVSGSFEHQMEVMKTTWQNFKIEVGQKILPYLSKLMSGAMPVLTKAMDAVMPVIEKVIQTVMPVIQDLGAKLFPVISDNLQKVAQLAADFLPQMFDYLSRLGEIIQPLFDKLTDAGTSILPMFMDMLGQGLGVLMDALPVVIDLITRVWDATAPVVEQIGTALANTITPLLETLMPYIQQIGDHVMSLYEALAPLIGDILSFIIPILGQVAESVLPIIMTAIDMLIVHITNIIEFVRNVFTGNWEGAWQNIKNIFNNFFDGFKKIIELWLDYFKKIPEILASVFELLRPILEGFAELWSKIWTGIKETFEKIWTGLSGIVKTAFNAVIGVINGAVGGINSILSGAMNMIKKIPGIEKIFGGSLPDLQIPEIPYLAKGGTITSPTLAMVGEAGPETVVPHNNTPRSRALLAEASRGVYGSSQNTYNVTFAPQISGDNAGEIAELTMQKFKAFMAQYQRDNTREAFA